METAKLKKFAQRARRSLIEQVSAKLELVLAADSAARRESAGAVKQLEEAIAERGKAKVADRVAYIWFNRFCALRFMDVNRYTRISVISPAGEQLQPEILADAKSGHIDKEMVPDGIQQQVLALLDGKAPSRDPQGEAYRLLLVAACNAWHKAMPFLFQRIDDYTELLMPDDLLSGNSILAHTREAMTPEACEDVEVIGWLYQFYISEKKDEVFAGLKKNQKITPENIPAATQFFTPHWIVSYLVENSLGRLWMLNRPESKLIGQMDYYIKPDQPETDFLRIGGPEEIKICDPACGSGHMLTYAFDLLHAIYEEEGYEPAEIPEKILTNNLFGIEIDERAGELAAFALTMKARARQRRFFSKGIKPNICVLEAIRFDKDELDGYMDFIGRDLFTESLQTTLREFEEADNFGSLIRPTETDVAELCRTLEEKNVSEQLFFYSTHKKVLLALRQATFLSPTYNVIIANPPYAAIGGLNSEIRKFSDRYYSKSKNDLYSMFIQRNENLCMKFGYIGMITMQSWMYLSTFVSIRKHLLTENTIVSLLHLGPMAFPEVKGERVQASAFVFFNTKPSDKHKPIFFRLISGDARKKELSFLRKENCFDQVIQQNFSSLSDFSLAYKMLSNEAISKKILHGSVINIVPKIGSQPGSELIYYWWEVNHRGIGSRWKKYNKGGAYRKWYGNSIWIVDFGKDGENITRLGGQIPNKEFYGEAHISWTRVSNKMNLRYYDNGVYFDNTSPAIFNERYYLIGYLNSSVGEYNRLGKYSGTKIEAGHIRGISPISPSKEERKEIESITNLLIEKSTSDWNSHEISWGFSKNHLLRSEYSKPMLSDIYDCLRLNWKEKIQATKDLERENNRIFINSYGLQEELIPDVSLNEITLTCNPWYRYGNGKTESQLEKQLLGDTMRELVSYGVGCILGRYAIDKPRLILANQGETIEDYMKQIPYPRFPTDEDNVIPMLNGNWFPDDITERFCTFLRITFGEEHYEENLRFAEDGLNIKGRRNYSIRDYFLGEFYADHVKRYKKRPIYWLFSSPKGSFNALIYMHRYRPETVSIVLNDYLREFRAKLASYKSHLEAVSISIGSSQGEKTKALKEIEKTNKMIIELEDYERDVLYPLATRQIEIDLDEGVKANYPKFGKALKKIPGLSA